jgi:hypothetical protein
MPPYKSQETIRTAEAMSCSSRSVKAGEVSDDIHSVCSVLAYDSLWLQVSRSVNQVSMEDSYGSC